MRVTSLCLLMLLLASVECIAQTDLKKDTRIYKDSAAINFFRRTKGWIASDGGITIRLSDGSTLWLMGDSFVDDYDSATGTVPCLFNVRNAALLQPAGDWNWRNTKTLIGNGPGIKSYFKNNPDDKYFMWPAEGFQLNDTIYVYCASLKNEGHGAFGFAKAGNDFFAKIKFPEMKVVAFSSLQNFGKVDFGAGFIKDEKSGFMYAYGQQLKSVENNLYVARFPISNPNSAWEFWNGNAWVKDPGELQPIAKQTLVEGTFQVKKVKDKIVLMSSALSVDCDQGKEIYASVSDNITGPFKERKTVYTIDDTLQGHYPFFYAAMIHPEFINDKDEVLITYAINGYGKCVETCINNRFNPDYYRLKAIRVSVEFIVSSE